MDTKEVAAYTRGQLGMLQYTQHTVDNMIDSCHETLAAIAAKTPQREEADDAE